MREKESLDFWTQARHRTKARRGGSHGAEKRATWRKERCGQKYGVREMRRSGRTAVRGSCGVADRAGETHGCGKIVRCGRTRAFAEAPCDAGRAGVAGLGAG